jgi:hypothetical protein
MDENDEMVTLRVPPGTQVLIVEATAEAEVIKAADIQPQSMKE